MPSQSKLRVVGLTGGIGSGKSTVANQFAALGVPIVDTDAIAHALTAADGAGMAPIRERFGEGVIAADGGLDRGAMRQRAFTDPVARRDLESLLHPMIREESRRQLAAASSSAYAMLVVPLLFEASSYRDAVQRTLVVDCPVEIQVRRVQRRSGLARDEIERIISSQIARCLRLQLADDVVSNTGGPGELDATVSALHSHYLALAGAGT